MNDSTSDRWLLVSTLTAVAASLIKKHNYHRRDEELAAAEMQISAPDQE